MPRLIRRTICTALLLTIAAPASLPARPNEIRAVQALVGAGHFNSGSLTFASPVIDPTLGAESDLAKMPMIGFVGHLPFDEQYRFGLEGSLLFGWRNHDVSVAGGSTTTTIRFETSLRLLDLSMGLFGNVRIGRHVRLFLGAGPTLLFADFDGIQKEDDGAGTIVTTDAGDSAFGVGGYARAGIEFRLPDGGMMGICVRGVSSDLDFSGTRDTDISGLQGFLSYSRGFDF